MSTLGVTLVPEGQAATGVLQIRVGGRPALPLRTIGMSGPKVWPGFTPGFVALLWLLLPLKAVWLPGLLPGAMLESGDFYAYITGTLKKPPQRLNPIC